jgi:outer membrane protein OmpA-like peptidoglycan-associated protein
MAAAIQQGQGNAFVSKLAASTLARQPDAEEVAKQAFVARGLMPSAAGLDMQSTTGLGGFNAKYDPASQALLLTLRVGIAFRDALVVNATTGAVAPATADFAGNAAAVTANFADVPSRVTEVQTNWNWAADAKTDWRDRYEASAEVAWGQQHYFQSNRWEDLYANVRVDLNVHEGHVATDHCKATVFKVPEGSSAGPGAVVNSTTGNATGSTGTFTSSALGPTSDYLNFSLQFPRDSASLADSFATSRQAGGDAGPTHLDKIIVDYQRGTATGGAPFTITGRASATGEPTRNRDLARRRAETVANYLRTRGQQIAGYRVNVIVAGDEGATAGEEWQRVDIMIGDGRPQVTMTHETGHMFGLDDEYASPPGGIAPGAGTPGAIGTATGHGPLAGAMGGGVTGAVYENNDNIMSVGNVVRPQHYATFLEALHGVSTPERFHYGGQGNAPTAIPDLFGPHVQQPATATA